MPRVEVALTVRLRSGMAVGGASAGAGGADRPVFRDGWGRLALPGSHVKGRLRHASERLVRTLGEPVCRPPRPETMCPRAQDVPAAPCLVCALFGSPGRPSPLRWGDLVSQDDSPSGPAPSTSRGPTTAPSAFRASLALNRRRGTAVSDVLAYVETSPIVPGGLCFASQRAIVGRLDDSRALHLLLAACRLVSGLGAGETRGLGWCEITAAARVDGVPLPFDPTAVGALVQAPGGGG